MAVLNQWQVWEWGLFEYCSKQAPTAVYDEIYRSQEENHELRQTILRQINPFMAIHPLFLPGTVCLHPLEKATLGSQ